MGRSPLSCRPGLLAALLVAVLVLARPAAAGDAEEERTSRAAELRAWLDGSYADIVAERSEWRARLGLRLQALHAQDAEMRKRAGLWLAEALVMAAEDTAQGRVPGRRGWVLGGHQDVGDELRAEIARRLELATRQDAPVEALAPALWLAESEVLAASRVRGAQLVVRIRHEASNAALRRWIGEPHPTHAVVRVALEAATERGLDGLAGAIQRLAGHYHPVVASAVRAAAERLGLPPLPPPTAEQPLPVSIVRRLEALATAVPDAIPADARWVRVAFGSRKSFDFDDWTGVTERSGWLLASDADHLVLLDIFGQRIPLAAREHVVHDEALVAAAEALVAARAAALADPGNEDADSWPEFGSGPMAAFQSLVGHYSFMSFRTPGKAPSWKGSLPEVLLAAWCHRAGDHGVARGLLLPLLAAHADERDLFDLAEHELLSRLDRAMLDAFCSRDAERALTLARHLEAPRFATWWAQDRARALAAELPRRQDDFVKRTLPTPTAWALARAALDRAAQVAYLAERLRLIHAEQFDIPGGLDWAGTQYAEAVHGQAAWSADATATPPTEVINPFAQLAGMNLSGDEAAILVPYLASEDHILGYDLPRFQPHWPRQLHRVRWLVAALLEPILGEGAIDRRLLVEGTAEQRELHLRALAERAREVGRRTEGDRWATTLATADRDEELQQALLRLGALEPGRAARILLQRARAEPRRRGPFVRLAYALDQRGTLTWFAPFVGHRDEAAAFWAAAMRLRHGTPPRRAMGRDHVLAALRHGDPHGRIDVVLDDLITTGDPRLGDLLDLYLAPHPPVAHRPTRLLLQRALWMGRDAAFARLREALDGTAALHLRDFDGDEHATEADDAWPDLRREDASRERLVDWVLWHLVPVASRDPTTGDPRPSLEERTQRALEALAALERAVQARKAPDLKRIERPSPLGRWQWLSSGWVLQTR